MICKVCQHSTKEIFKAEILYKYTISYFQCSSCGFIQTESPYWLEESYGEAIGDLDIGYVTRNAYMASMTRRIIQFSFDVKRKFMDYGGGYGLFVRTMRDSGFDFYLHDLYCENIFAKYFDVTHKPSNGSFELLTAFEVFEHLPDPLEEVEKMLGYSDSILFSTELQPKTPIKSSYDWWYFMPESGQHVAFYTKSALEIIAKKFDLNLYTNGRNLHLLTRKKLPFNFIKWFSYLFFIFNKLSGKYYWNKKSLINQDFKLIKSRLAESRQEKPNVL